MKAGEEIYRANQDKIFTRQSSSPSTPEKAKNIWDRLLITNFFIYSSTAPPDLEIEFYKKKW